MYHGFFFTIWPVNAVLVANRSLVNLQSYIFGGARGGVQGAELLPDRERVQRAAEVRPHAHLIRIRRHPPRHPRAADVDARKHTGTDDRKNRHGLCKSINGCSPLLPK